MILGIMRAYYILLGDSPNEICFIHIIYFPPKEQL